MLAALVEHGFTGAVDRVASKDSFIPLGDAALKVLLSEDTIEAAAVKLARSARVSITPHPGKCGFMLSRTDGGGLA